MNDVTKDLLEALLNVARMAENLKKPCGTDPESPQAIRNAQYMNISYAARAAITRAEAALAEPQPDAEEACTSPATRRQSIDALVGDRLTAKKADHICERDGYAVTGVVLTLPDGRACIVNRSAVRWLHGDDDLANLMHTDTAINQRLFDDAVQTEREACAKACERERDALNENLQVWQENPMLTPCDEFISNWDSEAKIGEQCAAAIRARGQK